MDGETVLLLVRMRCARIEAENRRLVEQLRAQVEEERVRRSARMAADRASDAARRRHWLWGWW